MADIGGHREVERVEKEMAVRRLRDAGLAHEAEALERWRDANGNNWGWDGWVRGAHPEVVDVIWP
jgi:hypothetical protein